MALTIADLLATPDLDLRLVAGKRGLARPIRWVHVSELDDPTPWLKGGELLLTTGIGVGKTPTRQRRYVERLVEAGLAGLGFGLGFSFRTVPKQVAAAADRAAFPLFEVPYELPFIAITEAVFTRLVAEQYDVLSRSLDAEHTLTRAVLDGQGAPGILRSLSRAAGGWTLLMDLHGAVAGAAPDEARQHRDAVWEEVRSSRHDGQRFSVSLVEGGHHIVVQPVTAQGRVEAFLSLGKREAVSQFDRIVFSHALSLLALELSKVRAVSEAERRLKGDLLDQLLDGSLGPDAGREALERFGFEPEDPVVATALAGTGPSAELALALEEALATGQAGPFLTSSRDDVVLALVQSPPPGFLPVLRSAVADRVAEQVMAGAGSSVPLEQLAQSVREARYALQVCRSEGRLHAEFADLGTYQLLLSLQDPEALRTFADSVLAPLDRYDELHGGDLVVSLRAFLERNAKWEAAAADLYVHRHTLRYRMRKVEELTGRALVSARDRMEFFLALRARELLASAGRRTPLSRPYKPTGALSPSAPRASRRKG